MPLYLDTRGNPTLGIGICARCSIKMPLHELSPDPNYPGLMVCKDDRDVLDPYRLPARPADKLTLPFVRPDTSVAIGYSGAATVNLVAMPIFGINEIGPARPWQPNTAYAAGDSITPLNVDLDTTTLPQNWWFCLLGGKSGATPPAWPDAPGIILGDYIYLTSDIQNLIRLLSDVGALHLQNDAATLDLLADGSVNPVDSGLRLLSDNGLTLFKDGNGDGTVTWLCLGIYPN